MTIDNFNGIFTKKQMETIHDNISIEKADYGKGFYVYTDQQRTESGSYTQYCPSLDYLDGWLYGAVQAINGIMKPISK